MEIGLEKDFFPDVDRFRNFNSVRDYIKKVLVEMASTKSLFITEIKKNTPDGLMEIVLEVLCGMIRNDTLSLINEDDYPLEFVNYRVKLKSLNGENIIYKTGKAPWRMRNRAALYKDKFKEISVDKDGIVDVDIKTAIMILKQMGKEFKLAFNSHSQMRNWKVEELAPEGFDPSNKPKKTKVDELLDILGDDGIEKLLNQLKMKGKK